MFYLVFFNRRGKKSDERSFWWSACRCSLEAWWVRDITPSWSPWKWKAAVNSPPFHSRFCVTQGRASFGMALARLGRRGWRKNDVASAGKSILILTFVRQLSCPTFDNGNENSHSFFQGISINWMSKLLRATGAQNDTYILKCHRPTGICITIGGIETQNWKTKVPWLSIPFFFFLAGFARAPLHRLFSYLSSKIRRVMVPSFISYFFFL